MKQLLMILLAGLSTACATGYSPAYYFNQMQVVNLTGSAISEVRLSIAGTMKTLSCDRVANNAICDERMGARRYPQQAIELNWVDAQGARKSEQLTPAIPAYFVSAFPLRVIVEVLENGTAKAYFEQDEPGRDGDSLFRG